MEKKPEEGEHKEEDIVWVNSEEPIVLVSGEGIGSPTMPNGKMADFISISFYFNPPEAETHTHVVHSRIAMDWNQAEDFAKSLLEYIKKYRPK